MFDLFIHLILFFLYLYFIWVFRPLRNNITCVEPMVKQRQAHGEALTFLRRTWFSIKGLCTGDWEGASHDYTSVRDKMVVCQLSYSLDNVSVGHIGLWNACLITDFN